MYLALILAAGAPVGPSDYLTTGWMQYGFGAFACFLLALVWWCFRELLRVQKEKNGVIDNNTNTTRDLGAILKEQTRILRGVHEALMTRPCLADPDQQGIRRRMPLPED